MTGYLFDLGYDELKDFFHSLGEPDYRVDQLWTGLFSHFWSSPDQFTTFPKELRHQLAELVDFTHLEPEQVLQSGDGATVKTLYRLPDGLAIETVLMSYQQRNTVCISSQVGCGMGCDFCATGKMGFLRNLSSGEIAEQVVRAAAHLAQKEEELTNVVFMGMGEPFHNYDNVMAAIDLLNDSRGMNIGARRFTISTVGLVPQIYRFAGEDRQVNLAVSLHAVENDLRSSMLAVNRKYPVQELLTACRHYVEKTNRRITFEWALIYGVNDRAEQARKLTEALGDLLVHVNVIPLNPNAHYPGQPSSEQRVRQFQQILQEAGIPCTVRLRRGIDIQAGCGQLASQANPKQS